MDEHAQERMQEDEDVSRELRDLLDEDDEEEEEEEEGEEEEHVEEEGQDQEHVEKEDDEDEGEDSKRSLVNVCCGDAYISRHVSGTSCTLYLVFAN